MNEFAKQAVRSIEGYKTNAVIMSFVKNEALEKVAAEISALPGRTATAKAVELLIQNKENINIRNRVEHYIAAGLVGCYMAHLDNGLAA